MTAILNWIETIAGRYAYALRMPRLIHHDTKESQ